MREGWFCRAGCPFQPFVLNRDEDFQPPGGVRKKKRNRKGVEDFVGDQGSDRSVNFLGRGNDGSFVPKPFLKHVSSGGEGFADDVVDRVGKFAIKFFGGGKEVEGERTVVGARFQNEEGIGGSVALPKSMKTVRQESPEHGADRDTGHEIAFFGDRG